MEGSINYGNIWSIMLLNFLVLIVVKYIFLMFVDPQEYVWGIEFEKYYVLVRDTCYGDKGRILIKWTDLD